MKTPAFELDEAVGDYVLMKDLATHDPAALAELHTRYRTILHRTVFQILHDESDTDDVLQDVFIQLWTKPKAYCADKGKPLGWLLTLSRRRAIDHLRRRNTYRKISERFECAQRGPHHQAQRELASDRRASQKDLRTFLVGLMHQLPPAQQTVVAKGFFEGLSQRQIASSLNIPLGTVKTRMELGLRKLANVILPVRAQVD